MVPLGRVRADAQTARVRVVTSPNDSGAEPFYAADMGFFKNAGLDVDLSIIGNVGGVNIPSAALAHQRGLPMVLVAPGAVYSSRTPTSALLVTKLSPIATARELNGKASRTCLRCGDARERALGER